MAKLFVKVCIQKVVIIISFVTFIALNAIFKMEKSIIINKELNELRMQKRAEIQLKTNETDDFLHQFLEYLKEFPSEDLSILSVQLDNFIYLFAQSDDISYLPIYKTNFTSILFSLFIENEMGYLFEYMLIYLINSLISPLISEDNILAFFLLPAFYEKLRNNLQLINSEDFHDKNHKQNLMKLISQSIILSRSIFEFIPNGKELIFSTGIIQICETQLITSDNFEILCLSVYFLVQIIPEIHDNDELVSISEKLGVILNFHHFSNNFRLITHLIHCIFLCMSKDANIRHFFVNQNICAKISELIQLIQNNHRFCFYNWIVNSMKILSLISNQGTDEEIRFLLESGVLDSIFLSKHSFIDCSLVNTFEEKDQVDFYLPICDFVVGLLMKNESSINSYFIESKIIEQCCNVIHYGEMHRKLSILRIIKAVVLIKNEAMLRVFLENNSFPIIFELMTSLDQSFLIFLIELIRNMMQIMPQLKDYIKETNFEECYSILLDTLENQEIIDSLIALYTSIFSEKGK